MAKRSIGMMVAHNLAILNSVTSGRAGGLRKAPKRGRWITRNLTRLGQAFRTNSF